MTPIPLGILDFPTGAAGAYDLLETQVLTSSATYVDFTGLDSYTDYKHLQLRMATRSTRSSTNTPILITLNSDTGSNYSYHFLYGNGTSVSSSRASNATYFYGGSIASASQATNIYSAQVIDILDFSNTNKNTTARVFDGFAGSANNFVSLMSGAWYNTSAVTSISMSCYLGDFVSGSRLSLYGVK